MADEIAIKPWFSLKDKKLFIDYNVDRCVELSQAEQAGLKVTLASAYDKQTALAKAWNFFTTCVNKKIIRDGVAEIERRIKMFEERSGNGRTY